MHGGKTPRGFAHPNTTHGRYSSCIPVKYLASMEESLNRPDFKSNRQQIALLDARADEVFQKIDSGEHGQAWRDMRQQVTMLAEIPEVPDAIVRAMRMAIATGLGEAENWRELRECFELRRKAVETDAKISKIDATTLDLEQTRFLVGVIVAAAREFLDKDDLQAFAERIEMNTPGGFLSRDTEKEDWS